MRISPKVSILQYKLNAANKFTELNWRASKSNYVDISELP